MNKVLTIAKKILFPKTKFSRIEQFVLSNYPPHKGHSMPIRLEYKPFTTTDFLNAISSVLQTTITRKTCEEMLLKLGYEKRLYRPPFERTQIIVWLIK